MELQELNKEELNELLGGETELAAGQDKNTNNADYCVCIYKNNSATNTNNAYPCSCNCKPSTT